MDATNSNSASKRIAVIGPTQSGKTCLAVGLFSTSTRGFTIDVPQRAERNYLNDRRRGIVSGTWPSSNNKGAVQDVRFDFHKKHRPDVKVEIVDFAGELLADDESFKKMANEHFRGLDGVVLLVNPGADAFKGEDAALLEDAKTQYSRILSFLNDSNNNSKNAFVALTVTAADRIRGCGADLHGKDEAFRDCLAGIENSLSSMDFKWKKFYVSMSGRTGEGNKFNRKSVPKGWPNTTSRPFLWILDCLGWRSIVKEAVKRFLKIAGCVALGLTAVAGLLSYFASESNYREIEKHFNKGRESLEACGTTANSLKKSFDNASNELRWLGAYSGYFYKEHANQRRAELAPAVADVRRCWIEREIDDVEENVGKVVGKHGDDVLKELLNLYSNIGQFPIPHDLKDLEAKKSNIETNLDKRVAAEFEELISQKSSNGLPEEKAREEFKPLLERLNSWNPITEDGKKQREELQEKLPKSQTDTVNAWGAEQKKSCEEWVIKEIVNQSNRPLAGPKGLFKEYVNFARVNKGNPCFASIVQSNVYSKVEEAFTKYVEWFCQKGGGTSALWEDATNFAVTWNGVNEKFASFRMLCLEVAADKTALQTSWAWQFARLCTDKNYGNIEKGFDKAFPQTIVIDKVVASADYHGNLPTNYKFTSFAARINVTQFNSNGSVMVSKTIDILRFDNGKDRAPESDASAVKASKTGAETKILLDSPNKNVVHAFEEVALEAVATDWNKGNWIGKSSSVIKNLMPWGERSSGQEEIDLSFELGRWTGPKKPTLGLAIDYHVEGLSMKDLMAKAKEEAKKAQ